MLLLLLLTAGVLISATADAARLPVDGTFRLRARKAELDRQLQTRLAGDAAYRSQLRASALSQQLVPGVSQVGFQVYNFSAGGYEYRPGRFVARGTHCNLFVERGSESAYGKDSAEIFARIVRGFDEKVFPSVGRWFGQPVIPKIFNLPDDRIYIFLVDIRDSFDEGYVAGYFDHRDLEGLFGNQKPVFFMDIMQGDPGNTDDKSNTFYRTLAHEFQHMVNFSIQHDNGSLDQDRWLDEGFSMFSEYVFSGEIGDNPARLPPSPHFERFLENPSVNLLSNARASWFQEESLFRQYGASFMFVAYLVEKYGGSSASMQQQFTRELIRTVPKGIDGLETLISHAGTSFAEVFVNFCLALAIDDPSLNNGLWGFANKTAAFGKSAALLPVRFGRSYAATGTGSFIGGHNSVSANSLNLEEINGKGQVNLGLTCERGMTPWFASIDADGKCEAAAVKLDPDGRAGISLDFSGLRRFFLLPVALSSELDAAKTFAYSFNSGTGSYVLYPVPNPAFAEQVMIFLRSEFQPLTSPPLLHINFNNLIEQIAFSATDETATTFVAHYQLPGNGRGQAVCMIGDHQVSFSFSVARLRPNQLAGLELGDSLLMSSSAGPDETMMMFAVADGMQHQLPAGAIAGPYDVIAGSGSRASLCLPAGQALSSSAGLCRVDAAGLPVSWQRPIRDGNRQVAEIEGSGRYFLFSDDRGPVFTTFALVRSPTGVAELRIDAVDDLSGVATGLLQVSVDGEILPTGAAEGMPLRVSLRGISDGYRKIEARLADQAGNHTAISMLAQIIQPVALKQAIVFPNPCRNQAHINLLFSGKPAFGEANVSIFSTAGHRVTTLPLLENADGLSATWDLRDHDGRPVSNGLYLYRAKAAAGGVLFRPTGRIAVLR
ncbi:MAG TPA: hypothetical protein PLM07_07550 [Candidatus Rifleibacterium sp.]|nr:hypothetical protein [Candidatus Rifleibacterium sp.]